MGRIRARSTDEVREKALATAGQKFDAGCESCAEGYLKLAQQHGATSEQVATVRTGRRDFLKFAAGIVAAGAVATATGIVAGPLVAHAAQPIEPQEGGFFGVDSCTSRSNAIASNMPVNFYIAEVGAGAYNAGCFETATAALVGPDFTHAYWGLTGPAAVSDPRAYGQQQGLAALQAASGMPAIGGHTLFADIEFGFGGWVGSSPEQNAMLLDSFLLTVASGQYVPGVYITNHDRDNWFPPTYRPVVPFVYWVAGGQWAGTMCPPCVGGCDTLTPVKNLWSRHVSHEIFAGQRAVLWQYWLSNFGCSGDFVFSPQSGFQAFTPAS